MREIKAPVSEIFYSYQGEGIYAGEPQVFVRFAGCNLKCGYCDTPENRSGGHGSMMTTARILRKIKSFRRKRATISLTGGEPLLYADFLEELMPKLKKSGFKTYLETNGTLPENYKKVRKLTDVVAMDIKLPSACGGEFWNESGRLLKMAGKKAFVKVVVDSKTGKDEIDKASRVAAFVSRSIPFVIQPSTRAGASRPAKPGDIYLFRRIANKKLSNIFIIPQLHRIWNVR